MSTISAFRGHNAISELLNRMAPLAAFYKAHPPVRTVLTVHPSDLAAIRRYPAAASAHHIHLNNGIAYWDGFELRATSSDRLQSRETP